ncbi:hypothetical protein [Nocardia sp. NPDC020380]|uniref:hypothetical protein n=1 Tax=Nocardia sp. NPDC020380 TaxID=3364309 RepID=UPI0037BD0303
MYLIPTQHTPAGTVCSVVHLLPGPLERELAHTLGVPYEKVMLAAFLPLAFTLGTGFRPAERVGRGKVLHWNGW